ncbi:MAG: EscU/YscU/HrcU family type III secretion system export apparatus switch protein, partial [Negativicutes bacterium]|nr:EscU/YscU/HrcU family type III secretion system export apparatus switch protein [Negativicutes bacterium]
DVYKRQILDYGFQKYRYIQNLKMSKEEVKEEYKQTEGDPKVKAKIKEKQRQLAMSRMMQQVPQAAVVVTNPSHFAVALQYETGMVAPRVVARGADFLAQRIRQVAQDSGVPVVENPPLARVLYWQTEIGDIIPSDLYRAVAELLAYVYRLKNRRRTA